MHDIWTPPSVYNLLYVYIYIFIYIYKTFFRLVNPGNGCDADVSEVVPRTSWLIMAVLFWMFLLVVSTTFEKSKIYHHLKKKHKTAVPSSLAFIPPLNALYYHTVQVCTGLAVSFVLLNILIPWLCMCLAPTAAISLFVRSLFHSFTVCFPVADHVSVGSVALLGGASGPAPSMLMMFASMMQQPSYSRNSIREQVDDPWKLLEDLWATCLLWRSVIW